MFTEDLLGSRLARCYVNRTDKVPPHHVGHYILLGDGREKASKCIRESGRPGAAETPAV